MSSNYMISRFTHSLELSYFIILLFYYFIILLFDECVGKQTTFLLGELSIRTSLRALEGYQAPPDFLSGFLTVDKKRSGE